MSSCRIRSFFKEQNVLVTGATGFLGKVVVEKLLRSCPEISSVFLLIRPSNGEASSVHMRLEQLLENSIFNDLKTKNANVFNKIHPVSGNMEQPYLGLSEKDKQLLATTVSTVIHSAATIKFDEPLEKALKINTNGTRRVLEICKGMTNLKSIVHVSTAYTNCDKNFIQEEIYPPPNGAKEIKTFLQQDKCGDINEKKLLDVVKKASPNTYLYSKALTEHILSEEATKLPICIVRPSMVSSSLNEPLPDWTDTANGPPGYFAAVVMGVMRVFSADPCKAISIVPVDVAANLILCTAWATSLETRKSARGSSPIKVYNCTSSIKNPLLYSQACRDILESVRNVCPFSKASWYPDFRPVQNRASLRTQEILFHYIPAVIHDAFYPVKKFSAVQLFHKLKRLTSTVEHFTLNEWHITTDNARNLYAKLNEEERKNFFFDVDAINWTSYLQSACFGIRRFIMKEDDSTLPAAHSRMQGLRKTSKVAEIAVIIFICTVMLSVSATVVVHSGVLQKFAEFF